MSQKISIQFRVNTIPVAQPRQRHGVNKHTGHVVNFIDKKNPVVAYKYAVQAALLELWGTKQAPLDIPLEIRLHFTFPRPKYMIWKKKPMPPVPHTSAPDIDNLQKSTFDALNGLLYRDDSLICKVTAIKTIASGTEIPHVYISVCDYDDYENNCKF
jgi:Holliday junction resolvase RusA-like endonuclease